VLGRSPNRDRATGAADRPGYDAQTKFGAGVLYDDGVAFAYTRTPLSRFGWMTLWASNKPSEHNIGNTLPRIVVAQLAGQTQPHNLKKLLSRPINLRPGNQSIGGT
jgi:hypothetical protein